MASGSNPPPPLPGIFGSAAKHERKSPYQPPPPRCPRLHSLKRQHWAPPERWEAAPSLPKPINRGNLSLPIRFAFFRLSLRHPLPEMGAPQHPSVGTRLGSAGRGSASVLVFYSGCAFLCRLLVSFCFSALRVRVGAVPSCKGYPYETSTHFACVLQASICAGKAQTIETLQRSIHQIYDVYDALNINITN